MATNAEKRFDKMPIDKKIDFIRGESDDQKVRWVHRMKSGTDKQKVIKEIPGLDYLMELNAETTGGGRKGGPGHGSTGGNVNIPTKERWQHELMKNAGKLSQEGLEDILNKLKQPYTSPINQQMEQMFGHLQNPIMQGLLNPTMGNQAMGSLMPDRIAQEYQQMQQQQQQQDNPINQLMGALGNHAWKQHAVPWLNNLKPEDIQNAYGYVEPGLNKAYENLQYLGGLPGQANQGLENYIQGGLQMRNPETMGQNFQQMMSTPLYAARHPLEALGELGQFGKNAFNYMRGQ